MKSTVVDEYGDVVCPYCGAKNSFTSKRSGKAKVGLGLTVGVGALLAPKRLQCQGCGKYLKTAGSRPKGPARARAKPVTSGGTTVMLTSAGPKKIQVIKVVREYTGLGLKEAKSIVDAAGTKQAVVGAFGGEDAAVIAAALTAAGAVAQLNHPLAGAQAETRTMSLEPEAGGVVGDLERLAALHASGALTDEEFAAAKRRIIDAQR